ncbi:glycosyltransferase [Thermosipho globiformans]|uniref:glycosyltransferase n=1 Tax=Thermosipho globiformans TaxID=380685 RepID=UPI001F49395F|nr:glycosyltransferase [Thermosipho globiformans]
MKEKGLFSQIQNLISTKKFKEAKNLAEKIKDETEKENVLGIISYYEKNLEESIKHFEKALKVNPIHSDALFNYSKVLFEKENYFESWRYLTRIHEKNWQVFDLLGDTQLKQDNPAVALYYYKKAAELSNIPEMIEKYKVVKDKFKKDVNLAIFCLPGLDNFIKDIAEILSNIYNVRLVVSTDGKQIQESFNWADIVWLEWANEMAIEITNKLPKMNKNIICRLHSYEALLDFPEKINWNNIDTLILVSDHIEDILKNYHSEIYSKHIKNKITIIPNGVNLNRFKFSIKKPGYDLAIVANINHKKAPEMWLQVIQLLKTIDERYTLHIAGKFQDIRYANYFNYFIKDSGLEKNVKLYGYINNINEFLKNKNYILSTSIHEGHPYNILEAMARGIKPLIHNYSGSKKQWPNELIFNFIYEIVEKVQKIITLKIIENLSKINIHLKKP